jgi:hypothetical protein
VNRKYREAKDAVVNGTATPEQNCRVKKKMEGMKKKSLTLRENPNWGLWVSNDGRKIRLQMVHAGSCLKSYTMFKDFDIKSARHLRDELFKRKKILEELFEKERLISNNQLSRIQQKKECQKKCQKIFIKYLAENLSSLKKSSSREIITILPRVDRSRNGTGRNDLGSKSRLRGMSKSL